MMVMIYQIYSHMRSVEMKFAAVFSKVNSTLLMSSRPVVPCSYYQA